MKKTLTLALLIGGANLFAAGSTEIRSTGDNEFFKRNQELFPKHRSESRNILKLNSSRFSTSGRDWDEAEVTKGGLFINFGLMFLPQDYMNPYYTSGDPVYKIGFDFEVGNFFRFAKISEGRMGIGLRATWLSVNYAKMTDENDIYRAAQISLIRLGPQFAVAVNETMGIDAYYTIGYNVTEQFGAIDDPTQKKDVGYSSTYTGISHELGAAFHYKTYQIGLGYRFGALTNVSNVYDGKDLGEFWLDDRRSSVNYFRVFIGFRF